MDLKPFAIIVMLHSNLLFSGLLSPSGLWVWMVSLFTSRNDLRLALRVLSWELNNRWETRQTWGKPPYPPTNFSIEFPTKLKHFANNPNWKGFFSYYSCTSVHTQGFASWWATGIKKKKKALQRSMFEGVFAKIILFTCYLLESCMHMCAGTYVPPWACKDQVSPSTTMVSRPELNLPDLAAHNLIIRLV